MRSLATGSTSLATFAQVLPRLPSLVRRMRPTWHLGSLAALDPSFLRLHGIRGLIWDVDGTLTGDRGPELLDEAAEPFRALLALPDVRHVILSNASDDRFRQLGDIFPTVPLLRGYRLGHEVLYRRRLGRNDDWSPEELELRLAEGARVIRKPSAVLTEFAVRELGCAKDETLMIGDQYLTDVAGANLAGVWSVKLPTIAPRSFRKAVRLSQLLEGALYRLLYGAPEPA